MTNRDKLLAELQALTNEQLEMVLFGVQNYSLSDRVDRLHCAECKRRFNGCPTPDSAACATSTADWLGWECTTGKIIDDKLFGGGSR